MLTTRLSEVIVAGTMLFLVRCTSARGGGEDGASLSTACETDGSSAHYEETLSGSGSTMVRTTASDTGCPNHVNWAINPNDAREVSSSESIPAYPMLIDSSDSTMDLSSASGQVGILFNGVAVFSGYAGSGQATTYEESAVYLEGDTFDLCGGHSTSVGWYHYHNSAGCLQEQAMTVAGTTTSEHSPQLGWSYDGFPIYGQLGPDGIEMLLCGNDGANDTYCLDLCGGYEAQLPAVDEFVYRYYQACGFDELYFPFTTNCYRGCCPSGITCADHVETCGSDATEGYTDDYTPEAASALDDAYESELIEGTDTDMIDSDNYIDCSLYLGSYSASSNDDDDSSSPRVRPGFATRGALAATLSAAFALAQFGI